MPETNPALLESQVESSSTRPFADSISDPNKRPRCFQSTFQECLFVLTATMSIGMFQFLYGITTVVTASIAQTLNMSSAEVTWINASFALTSGSFVLLFAKIADDFGRRPLLIFSLFAFAVSAVIAGFATNATYLNILGGVMGLWSAAAVSPAVGILGAAYERPSKRKNMAFACFSAGNPVGFVMGSLLSGVLAEVWDWRASYWGLGIVYAIFWVGSWWSVPKEVVQRESFSWVALQKFDGVGVLLSMAGLGLLCCSLTIAGDAPEGWKTGYVMVLLIIGVLLILGFITWESLYKNSFMPLYVWKEKNFCLINMVVILGFMSFATCDFWLALYMQNVLKYSPLSVGVHLLPAAVGGILMNIVAAFILHRVNNTMLAGIGAISLTASAILLATMKEDSSYWAFIFPSLILSVIGADLIFNVGNMYVMSSLPSSQQSLAGGIFNTVNKMCVTIGLGIASSIYNGLSEGHLALQTKIRPYTMVFWFGVAAAGTSCLFVPFLSIGTQGGSERDLVDGDRGSRELLTSGDGEGGVGILVKEK